MSAAALRAPHNTHAQPVVTQDPIEHQNVARPAAHLHKGASFVNLDSAQNAPTDFDKTVLVISA